MVQCIRIGSVTSSATSLLLDTSITNATIYNGQKVRFCIHADFPATTTVVPVFITINETDIPLQDALGNTLYSDQIRNCYCYTAAFGTEPIHLKLCTLTCKSQAVASSVIPEADTEGGA